MRWTTIAGLLAIAYAAPAHAAGDKWVAVFPFPKAKNVDAADAAVLESATRTLAFERLQPWGYSLLTPHTQEQRLKDNGLTMEQILAACTPEHCPLQAAQELKIDAFVAGSVVRTSSGMLTVSATTYQSATGRVMGSIQARGRTVEAAEADLRAQAAVLFGGLDPGVAPAALAGNGAPHDEAPQGGTWQSASHYVLNRGTFGAGLVAAGVIGLVLNRPTTGRDGSAGPSEATQVQYWAVAAGTMGFQAILGWGASRRLAQATPIEGAERLVFPALFVAAFGFGFAGGLAGPDALPIHTAAWGALGATAVGLGAALVYDTISRGVEPTAMVGVAPAVFAPAGTPGAAAPVGLAYARRW